MERLVANITANTRLEHIGDTEYLVVPVTMAVHGVLAGNKGPLYYPEDELGKDPAAWNHVPLVVYHPRVDNAAISARDPQVLNKSGIGFVFNAYYDHKRGKLKAEGWFNLERTKQVDQRVYNSLRAGKPIELSTGLFTDNEKLSGDFNGKSYSYVARNYRPDHLAILPDEEGACSMRDGCGVLVNKKSVTANCDGDKLCPECAAKQAKQSKKKKKKQKAGGPMPLVNVRTHDTLKSRKDRNLTKLLASSKPVMWDSWSPYMREKWVNEILNNSANCGTGAGGFKKGNKCGGRGNLREAGASIAKGAALGSVLGAAGGQLKHTLRRTAVSTGWLGRPDPERLNRKWKYDVGGTAVKGAASGAVHGLGSHLAKYNVMKNYGFGKLSRAAAGVGIGLASDHLKTKLLEGSKVGSADALLTEFAVDSGRSLAAKHIGGHSAALGAWLSTGERLRAAHGLVQGGIGKPIPVEPSELARRMSGAPASAMPRFAPRRSRTPQGPSYRDRIRRMSDEEYAAHLRRRYGVTSNMLVLNDCGTGAGGFKKGNKCARGGGSGAQASEPSSVGRLARIAGKGALYGAAGLGLATGAIVGTHVLGSAARGGTFGNLGKAAVDSGEYLTGMSPDSVKAAIADKLGYKPKKQIVKLSDEIYASQFSVDNKLFYTYFSTVKGGDKSLWQVDFSRLKGLGMTDYSQQSDMGNSGGRVFRQVAKLTDKFIGGKKPKKFAIGFNLEEERRGPIYERFARTLARTHGYEVSKKKKEGFGYFILKKKKSNAPAVIKSVLNSARRKSRKIKSALAEYV